MKFWVGVSPFPLESGMKTYAKPIQMNNRIYLIQYERALRNLLRKNLITQADYEANLIKLGLTVTNNGVILNDGVVLTHMNQSQ